MFYVSAREMGAYYFKSEAEYKPGVMFAGGGERTLPAEEKYGSDARLWTPTPEK